MNAKLNMTQQCALAAQKPKVSWTLLPNAPWAAGEGGILPFCSGEIPPGVPHPALGAPNEKYVGLLEFQMNLEDDQRIRAPLLWREAERVGVVQPR